MFKFAILLVAVFICLHSESSVGPNVAFETRTKIAIIDTGLKRDPKFDPYICKTGSISLVDEDVRTDSLGHGSNVAGLIIENINPETHCIVMIKFWDKKAAANSFQVNVVKGIEYATKIGAKYLNLSLGGETFIQSEHDALQKAIDSGMNISVAAGNDSGRGPEKDAKGKVIFKRDFRGNLILRKNSKGRPVCRRVKNKKICFHELVEDDMGADFDGPKGCVYFPACYDLDPKHFHVVGSRQGRYNNWKGIHNYSNYGAKVKFWEDGTQKGEPPMTGTSMSTAIHTGKWASGKIP